MEYVNLGRSDLKVSRIGLGAWQWGSKQWGWGRSYGREDVLRVVDKAVELGINFIDTAEIYGGGLSEKLVGEAVKGRREEFVIATKVSPMHLRYGGVLKAAAGSLERLDILTIDLYQIHWPNPAVPIKSTIEAMEKLVEEGKVRYIGVSNFGASRLKKALEASKSGRLVSNQVKYNMIERSIERDLLPYTKENGVEIVAYSPFAQGVLTGRYDEKTHPKTGVQSVNILFSSINMRRLKPLLDTLREIAKERGVNVPQVALNWLLKDENVIPIPGVKKPENVEDIAGACGWRLNKDELDRIEGAYRRFRKDRILSGLQTTLRVITRR